MSSFTCQPEIVQNRGEKGNEGLRSGSHTTVNAGAPQQRGKPNSCCEGANRTPQARQASETDALLPHTVTKSAIQICPNVNMMAPVSFPFQSDGHQISSGREKTDGTTDSDLHPDTGSEDPQQSKKSASEAAAGTADHQEQLNVDASNKREVLAVSHLNPPLHPPLVSYNISKSPFQICPSLDLSSPIVSPSSFAIHPMQHCCGFFGIATCISLGGLIFLLVHFRDKLSAIESNAVYIVVIILFIGACTSIGLCCMNIIKAIYCSRLQNPEDPAQDGKENTLPHNPFFYLMFPDDSHMYLKRFREYNTGVGKTSNSQMSNIGSGNSQFGPIDQSKSASNVGPTHSGRDVSTTSNAGSINLVDDLEETKDKDTVKTPLIQQENVTS